MYSGERVIQWSGRIRGALGGIRNNNNSAAAYTHTQSTTRIVSITLALAGGNVIDLEKIKTQPMRLSFLAIARAGLLRSRVVVQRCFASKLTDGQGGTILY